MTFRSASTAIHVQARRGFAARGAAIGLAYQIGPTGKRCARSVMTSTRVVGALIVIVGLFVGATACSDDDSSNTSGRPLSDLAKRRTCSVSGVNCPSSREAVDTRY